MKTKIFNLFFFSFLALGSVFAETATLAQKSSEEKVLLSYKLKKDESYYITTKMEMDLSQTLPGQPAQNVQSTVQMGTSMDILSVDNEGIAIAKLTYDHIIFESNSIAGKVSFDSKQASNDSNPALLPFKSMLGKSFEMTLLPNGKVKNIIGMEKFIEGILASISDVDPTIKAMLSNQIKKQFSEKALIEAFEKTSAIYPTHEITTGDSWDISFDISNPYPMSCKNIYKLKSNLENFLEVDIEGTVSSLNNITQQMGQFSFKQDLSGTTKGSFTINKESGWIESGIIDQNLSGKLVNIPTETMKNEITIPFSMKIKTTIHTKKI